jgi:magnesium chelatase subunit D
MEKYEAPQMPPSTLVWSDDRVKRKNKSALSPGKRAVIVDQAGRGRAIRDIRPKEYHGRIAFTASIRAALLARPVLPVRLKPQDIRIQLRERGLGEELLFVVDASGSMGAHHRMAFVKGALLDLLKDSYRKRDSVGLLVFKDSQAELVVPPTRSLHKVYTTLANLRTGGKTPLEEALKKTAVHVLGRHAKEPASRTRVILVSDGRVPKAAESSCLSLAESMAALPARYLVIDNEHGWAGIGTGKKLANALRAEYRHLEELLL